MWSSALPDSLFSCISFFIAVLSHFLGLLGTACLRSARFARSRASRAPKGNPSRSQVGILVAYFASPGAIFRRLGAISGSLGAYFARLDAYLPRLGTILGRLGRVLASHQPPKIASRRLQDTSQE